MLKIALLSMMSGSVLFFGIRKRNFVVEFLGIILAAITAFVAGAIGQYAPSAFAAYMIFNMVGAFLTWFFLEKIRARVLP